MTRIVQHRCGCGKNGARTWLSISEIVSFDLDRTDGLCWRLRSRHFFINLGVPLEASPTQHSAQPSDKRVLAFRLFAGQ
jgi:hypothetical protein